MAPQQLAAAPVLALWRLQKSKHTNSYAAGRMLAAADTGTVVEPQKDHLSSVAATVKLMQQHFGTGPKHSHTWRHMVQVQARQLHGARCCYIAHAADGQAETAARRRAGDLPGEESPVLEHMCSKNVCHAQQSERQ